MVCCGKSAITLWGLSAASPSVELSLLLGNVVNRAKVRPTGWVNGNMQFL